MTSLAAARQAHNGCFSLSDIPQQLSLVSKWPRGDGVKSNRCDQNVKDGLNLTGGFRGPVAITIRQIRVKSMVRE
jgi:hypothetical protein